MSPATKTYKFAEFTLDPVRRTLRRVSGEIKLNDKDFDVLLFLIENAPKFCPFDQIIRSVWGGINVGNNSVEKIIANLRKTLGDDSANPHFIKTGRGKGYAFIHQFQEICKQDFVIKQENFVSEAQVKEVEPVVDPTDRGLRGKKINLKIPAICFAVIFFLFITVLFRGKDKELWARFYANTIFADSFSEKELDTRLWTVSGNSVKLADGTAQVQCLETDNCGRLISDFVSFDPKKPITVKSRMKVYASRNLKNKTYFLGLFGLTPKNANIDDRDTRDKSIFGVNYADYDYESRYPNGEIDEFPAEGWFLFRNGGSPQKKVNYRDGKVGKRMEPLWDTWFEQEITYDPTGGTISYYINDKLLDAFQVGDLYKDLEENKIRIEIAPRGWWLNHSIEIDYIKITQ